jgi:hypothetical protein
MSELAAFIDRYVSVWNETDPDARKRTIVALWAPDGTTCNRQLEACGYEAIEARVASANQKWVRDQGFTFRPRKSFTLHHHIVTLVWEMVPASGGEMATTGLNILILSSDGRIRADYQFSEPPAPASRELTAFVDRYVAFWNEPDANRRRQELTELWAEDATFLSATSEQHGWVGIEAEALETYAACGAKGFVIRSTDESVKGVRIESPWRYTPGRGTGDPVRRAGRAAESPARRSRFVRINVAPLWWRPCPVSAAGVASG